jgi:hypothetical protein
MHKHAVINIIVLTLNSVNFAAVSRTVVELRDALGACGPAAILGHSSQAGGSLATLRGYLDQSGDV